jgi:hypothetical protein
MPKGDPSKSLGRTSSSGMAAAASSGSLNATLDPDWTPDLMALQAETTAVLGKFGSAKFSASLKSDTMRSQDDSGMNAKSSTRKVKGRRKRRVKVARSGVSVKKSMNTFDVTAAAPQHDEGSGDDAWAGGANQQTLAWNAPSTVEVLERDSLRDEYDSDNDSPRRATAEILSKNEKIRAEEEGNRDLPFATEEARVRTSVDAFTVDDTITAADLEAERLRLDKILNITRSNAIQSATAAIQGANRAAFLADDISANNIQRAFRGHIGRRRFILAKHLRSFDVLKSRSWVEVRDQERGEVWYYNQISGESAWEKPDAMTKLEKEEGEVRGVKTLPPVKNVEKVDVDSMLKGRQSSVDTSGEEKKEDTVLPKIAKSATFKDDVAGAVTTSTATTTTGHLPEITMKSNQLSSDGSDEDDEDLDVEDEDEEFDFSDMEDEQQRLFLGDGSVNLNLRSTIEQSLKVSRFDSVSTLLASGGPELELDEKKRKRMQNKLRKQKEQEDRTRPLFFKGAEGKKMVSVLRIKGLQDDEGGGSKTSPKKSGKSASSSASPTKSSPMKSLALHDVPHTGFDLNKDDELHPDNADLDNVMLNAPRGNANDTTQSQVDMWKSTGQTRGVCFNCWSAGKGKKCLMHKEAAANSGAAQPSKTESALMCKNWDLGVLRRRYRAEEIQEVFMRSASSLRYDKERKQFCTVVEQKHPIYRLVGGRLAKYNFTSRRKQHTTLWLRSFIEALRCGKIPGEKVSKSAGMLRLRNSLMNLRAVRKTSNKHYTRHPKAPITGTTLAERRGQLQQIVEKEVVFERPDKKQEIKTFRYIVVDGVPVPIALYMPRVYELFAPKSVPMPEPSYKAEPEVAIPNLYIDETDSSAWLERLVSRVSRDVMQQAKLMIQTMSPIPGIDKLKRTKYPPPLTIKFATFARKPTKNNMAMGGLSAELTVYELVTTYVPPQYGHFTVMDRMSIAPDITEEITAMFLSLTMDPVPQIYVDRMLQHPLNSRRPPTITLSTAMDPGNKFYFGFNRPNQTGEEASHGFRTACWCMAPIFDPTTRPDTFLPSHSVATLNLPAANRTVTTHADRNYPFCEPTNRDNTTLDFYHLLLLGVCSPSKEQVFTNLGVQEPGDFMRGCDASRPLGHCVAVIYRSWAFLQKAPIEEFLTDDGVPYWYDRRTGETFWERPLHKEEKVPVKEGGSVLGGGGEMPSVGQGASKEYEPRYDQRDMRKAMIRKHESEEMTIERRKAASQSAVWAKEQGIIPDLPDFGSDGKEEDDGSLVSDESGAIGAAFRHAQAGGAVEAPQSPPRLNSPNRGRPASSSFGDGNGLSPNRRRTGSAGSDNGSPSRVRAANNVDQQTASVVNSITIGLADQLKNLTNPEDILKLGMGLGMTLQQQGVVKASSPTAAGSPGKKSPLKTDEERVMTDGSGWDIKLREPMGKGAHPIGMADPTLQLGVAGELDHEVEDDQKARLLKDTANIKTSDTFKGMMVVEPTPPPDEITGGQPMLMDSEEMMKLTVPVMAYPDRVGPLHKEFETHPAAGHGTSFVPHGEGESQQFVEGEDAEGKKGGVVVRRSSEPIPEGFLNAIGATHVGKQNVDYLPSVPNLPQCKPVGRVKPRSAAEDWLAIGFDPWSAGKEPLSTEFITSLTTAAATVKDDSIFENKEADGAFINLMDKKGLEAQAEIAAQENKMAQDFADLCSFVRHGKYREVEEKMNEPDWTLPIDYPDAVGNTLLMVACQNGNKRIAKLCLRRGAELNKQNINGQSCLHYAFGYGFESLGEYLVDKGADDSLKNADALTCYEGLNMTDVSGI